MNRADPRRVTAVVRIQEANPAHVTVSVWVGRQPGSRGRAGTLAFGANEWAELSANGVVELTVEPGAPL